MDFTPRHGWSRGIGRGSFFFHPSFLSRRRGIGGGGSTPEPDPTHYEAWDIGADEFGATGSNNPEEFDVAGATYYAVAPAGYSYSSEQDTNYNTRKYNTLAAAEAALPATPSTPIVINVIGSWTSADTTAVTISGVTTTASNYLLIRAIGVARHEGVWDDTKYRLYIANTSALTSEISHLRIDGLLIGKSSSSNNLQACIHMLNILNPNETHISNCVLRQAGSSYNEPGIYIFDADAVVKVWNTIIYGLGSATGQTNTGIYCQSSAVEVYSSTVIGGRYGLFKFSGTLTTKNCYARTSSGSAYFGVTTMVACASSDATGNTGLQNITHDNTTFVNTTAGSQDYHLAAGSPLIDAGVYLDTEDAPLNFITDIDGQQRGNDPSIINEEASFTGAFKEGTYFEAVISDGTHNEEAAFAGAFKTGSYDETVISGGTQNEEAAFAGAFKSGSYDLA